MEELPSATESPSSPITIRSLDRQTRKSWKKSRKISFAEATSHEELKTGNVDQQKNVDAAQRPVSLKITSKARASSLINHKGKQKRSLSIDMLGGTGAYESGDVDDLVSNYKPLLTTFELIKKPLGLPYWFPTFEKTQEGINLPSAIRSKKKTEKINCCSDDEADTLVQDIRINIKVQVRSKKNTLFVYSCY